MKTKTRSFGTVSALLLLVLAGPGSGMPPIPHTLTGRIERIDVQSREVAITNSHGRVALTWTDTTRFGHTCLNPQDEVKAYYRKEAGRLVAREIRAVGATICSSCCN
ncbi:MAG: hypothetical protein L0Y58_19415 [Verrucomicrobia subdivision 3 bacterium]|nr:hypothetical protein [Limisphaerales bacterium]